MEWMIDPAHSMIEFRAKHMMFTTVRGQFSSFQGTLDLDKDSPQNSRVEGSVEVASIDTGDKDRDVHLRSDDFFAVEQEPRMTFRSTRIEPQGDNKYKVHGDLTIRCLHIPSPGMWRQRSLARIPGATRVWGSVLRPSSIAKILASIGT